MATDSRFTAQPAPVFWRARRDRGVERNYLGLASLVANWVNSISEQSLGEKMMKVKQLVLLPGLDGTGQMFAPLLQVLPAELKISIARYPRDQKLTYAQLRPYVLRTLPPTETFALIAESFSGPLAVEVAATPPENLQAVILCASFVSNPVPPLLQWISAFNHPLWFRYRLPREFVRYAAALWDCDETVIAQLIESTATVQPEVLAHRFAQVMQVDVRAQLQGCELPLLYLRAKRDVLVWQKNWAEISRLKPDARCIEIDASHFVLQHNPAAAWAAMNDFFTANFGL